jgi:poly(3-hydroxybutyrate) depolymerase
VALSCADGRQYQLWVPTKYNEASPAPLVVALHGLGDTHTNFIAAMKYVGWVALADSEGFIIMVPASNNTTRKSFLHIKGTSSLDAPGTQKEARDLLDCVYKDLGARYNIETTQIYWIGFSEGATFSVYAAYIMHNELRAVAPYAGGMSGLTLPTKRKIPAYFICGTRDYSFTAIQAAYNAWIAGGHPGKSAWVSGVTHSFTGLNSQGPKARDVYQWLSTVKTDPVVSGYKK